MNDPVIGLFFLAVLIVCVDGWWDSRNDPFVSYLTPEQQEMLEDPEDGSLS